MKRVLYLLLAAMVLVTASSCSGGGKKDVTTTRESGDTLQGTIQLSGAFALYPMAVKWAEEFKKIHPNVRIDISGGGAGKGMTDALAGVVDIGMVSREVYPEEIEKGAFPIAVIKDAVVPTISTKNPDLQDILKKGITAETALKLWNKEFTTWGQVIGTSSKTPLHVFTRSDACGAAETFAAWFGKRQDDLKGTAVFGDPGVASAVQKDAVGVGFNNIGYVYDQNSKKPFEGLAVLPLDVNGDGQITDDERFYETSGQIVAAIQDGRFPSPPARDLYMVAKGKPQGQALIEFLKYVLTEGQQYAGETGYIGLSDEKIQRELDKLK